MAFQIVVETTAIQDIQAAIDYYDKQQIDLGKRFNTVLDEHILTIGKNPYFQIIYKDYRSLPIKKYPYIIIFYLDVKINTVYITAVFQTDQNPDKILT
jgi:toxin ParE1/3/4